MNISKNFIKVVDIIMISLEVCLDTIVFEHFSKYKRLLLFILPIFCSFNILSIQSFHLFLGNFLTGKMPSTFSYICCIFINFIHYSYNTVTLNYLVSTCIQDSFVKNVFVTKMRKIINYFLCSLTYATTLTNK